MFVIDKKDANGTGNGDFCVRTDKGALAALVYSCGNTEERAHVIAAALNAAFSPSMTDMMVEPSEEWWAANPPPGLDEVAEVTPHHGGTP